MSRAAFDSDADIVRFALRYRPVQRKRRLVALIRHPLSFDGFASRDYYFVGEQYRKVPRLFVGSFRGVHLRFNPFYFMAA